MVLACTGTQPEHAVNYQLVLQNQDDTDKSVAKVTDALGCSSHAKPFNNACHGACRVCSNHAETIGPAPFYVVVRDPI